jgi:hypothetical protein
VLICILTTVLFLGGYLYDYMPNLLLLTQYTDFDYYLNNVVYYSNSNNNVFSDPLLEGLIYGLALGIKSCFMIFVFI